jgi:hypothetical protein
LDASTFRPSNLLANLLTPNMAAPIPFYVLRSTFSVPQDSGRRTSLLLAQVTIFWHVKRTGVYESQQPSVTISALERLFYQAPSRQGRPARASGP